MKDRTLSGRLKEKSADLKLRNEEIRNLKLDIMTLEEKLNATQLTLSETESKLAKWELKQEKGYSWEISDNGYIIGAGTVPPYPTFIYTQEIPNEIGTRAYRITPFYKNDNGKIEKDIQKYKKYLGGL